MQWKVKKEMPKGKCTLGIGMVIPTTPNSKATLSTTNPEYLQMPSINRFIPIAHAKHCFRANPSH